MICQVPDERNLYVVDAYAPTDTLLSQWADERLDERVKRLVRHLAVELEFSGYEAVITSIWRKRKFDKDGKPLDSGIHEAWRGVDLRETTPRSLSTALVDRMNIWFPYDLARPRMLTIPPLDHGDGPHFHLQVKPGG